MKGISRLFLGCLMSFCVILSVFAGDLPGKIEKILYPLPNGGKNAALYVHPSKDKVLPAVIFNHGAIVEFKGLEEAQKLGYDIESYLTALSKSNFAVIAPIRKIGILPSDILSGCMSYLKSQGNIDPERIGMVGFSRGGTITYLESGQMNLRAVVLMSPAGARREDREIHTRLHQLNMPVFLTLGNHTDNQGIIRFCREILIPVLEKSNDDFTYKTGYPGNHKWFWKVRDEHWPDVDKFLKKHLYY